MNYPDPSAFFGLGTFRNLAIAETMYKSGEIKDAVDTPGDAFRHTYLNIIMCKIVNRYFAEKMTNLHEYGRDNWSPYDVGSQMDIHNNSVGRMIYANHPNMSLSEYSDYLCDKKRYVYIYFDPKILGSAEEAIRQICLPCNRYKLVYIRNRKSALVDRYINIPKGHSDTLIRWENPPTLPEGGIFY